MTILQNWNSRSRLVSRPSSVKFSNFQDRMWFSLTFQVLKKWNFLKCFQGPSCGPAVRVMSVFRGQWRWQRVGQAVSARILRILRATVLQRQSALLSSLRYQWPTAAAAAARHSAFTRRHDRHLRQRIPTTRPRDHITRNDRRLIQLSTRRSAGKFKVSQKKTGRLCNNFPLADF